VNKDGILTHKEIESSDKTLGPEIIEGLFLVADTNKDGRITYEEFKQISTAFGQQNDKHSQSIGVARSLLETIDTDKDGKLSQREVYNFVSQFKDVTEQAIGVVFYQLDTNRDNYINLAELQVSPQKITDLAGFQQMPTV
jgi:Ca2+-binding EF-hand superfamily protein